jgi:hypothetical protein
LDNCAAASTIDVDWQVQVAGNATKKPDGGVRQGACHRAIHSGLLLGLGFKQVFPATPDLV